MANFPLFPQDGVLTTAGRQAILKSLGPDYDLLIYKASLGDQALSGGSLEAITGVQHEVLTLMIHGESQQAENGRYWLHVFVDQTQTLDGRTSFLLAELAIMAKLRNVQSGVEEDVCLIANNAYGFAREVNLSDAGTIQTLEWEFFIPLSGEANITVDVGSNPVYTTPTMVRSLIGNHNTDPNAHKPLFDAVRAWAQGLIDTLSEAVQGVRDALDNHKNNRSNPHQVSFAQILGPDGVVAVENGGTGSQYHQYYHWTLSSGHLYCTINGYEMKYWGSVSGLGVWVGVPRDAVISLPIPFGSAQYWASAETFNADDVVQDEATVKAKSANSLTVRFNGGAGNNKVVHFCCIGFAAPLNSIPNRPGAPAFYPPLSHQTDPPPIVENVGNASVGYTFSAADNWQPTGDGQFALNVTVGDAGATLTVVDVTDTGGAGAATGWSVTAGVATITADAPFDGMIFVMDAVIA